MSILLPLIVIVVAFGTGMGLRMRGVRPVPVTVERTPASAARRIESLNAR